MSDGTLRKRLRIMQFLIFLCQLHTSLQHPDEKLLEHVSELLDQLDALGIRPSAGDDEEGGGEDGWEDVDESDPDIEMS